MNENEYKPHKFEIGIYTHGGKFTEIVNHDPVKAMAIASAMEQASEVQTVRVYLNYVKIHEWNRPRRDSSNAAFVPR